MQCGKPFTHVAVKAFIVVGDAKTVAKDVDVAEDVYIAGDVDVAEDVYIAGQLVEDVLSNMD